jgi:hypothetical protein
VTRVTPLALYREWIVQAARQGAWCGLAALARNHVRQNSLGYLGLRGEGSTPVLRDLEVGPQIGPQIHRYFVSGIGQQISLGSVDGSRDPPRMIAISCRSVITSNGTSPPQNRFQSNR